MSTPVTPQAAAKREAARSTTGRFGEQVRGEGDVDVDQVMVHDWGNVDVGAVPAGSSHWGKPEKAEEMVPGVMWVKFPDVGAFHLSEQRNAVIPEDLRQEWYVDGLDAEVVAWFHPDAADGRTPEMVADNLRRYRPTVWARISGEIQDEADNPRLRYENTQARLAALRCDPAVTLVQATGVSPTPGWQLVSREDGTAGMWAVPSGAVDKVDALPSDAIDVTKVWEQGRSPAIDMRRILQHRRRIVEQELDQECDSPHGRMVLRTWLTEHAVRVEETPSGYPAVFGRGGGAGVTISKDVSQALVGLPRTTLHGQRLEDQISYEFAQAMQASDQADMYDRRGDSFSADLARSRARQWEAELKASQESRDRLVASENTTIANDYQGRVEAVAAHIDGITTPGSAS